MDLIARLCDPVIVMAAGAVMIAGADGRDPRHEASSKPISAAAECEERA